MSDYERGYEQGLEDGHRCEKRHARLASLEKQVATYDAAIAQAKEEGMRIYRLHEVELWNGDAEICLASDAGAAIAQAKREVWERIDERLAARACLYVGAMPESKGEALYVENLHNLEWCRVQANKERT